MSETPPPITPPPPPGADGQGQAKKASGLAVAALVLGICGLIPVLGLILGLTGVILGIIVLAKKSPGQGLALGGVAVGAVGVLLLNPLLVAILVPAVGRARELAKRAACMANLNGIGHAMAIYTTDGANDEFPPDLETLIRDGQPEKFFKCPSAKSGRRHDYFYLRPSLSAPGHTIILCDFKGNHGSDYRNVLCVNLSVDNMTEAEFQSALADPANAEFAKALREAEGP